jgi:hypothetical protein
MLRLQKYLKIFITIDGQKHRFVSECIHFFFQNL